MEERCGMGREGFGGIYMLIIFIFDIIIIINKRIIEGVIQEYKNF